MLPADGRYAVNVPTPTLGYLIALVLVLVFVLALVGWCCGQTRAWTSTSGAAGRVTGEPARRRSRLRRSCDRPGWPAPRGSVHPRCSADSGSSITRPPVPAQPQHPIALTLPERASLTYSRRCSEPRTSKGQQVVCRRL